MIRPLATLALLLALHPCMALATETPPLSGWPAGSDTGERALEARLMEVPDPQRIAKTHERLTREPHPAGSPGDARLIEYLAETYRGLGLETEVHEFHPLLPVHEGSLVQVIHEGKTIELPLQEAGLAEDPFSASEAAEPAYNAFSASGDVRGEVVYVNYAVKEDFEKLAELGVSLEGKIAIARYGRSYRGYKAKFAEEAGAAGLILYTDPEDSGYQRGIPYPEGGYANEHYIQRGSLVTLAYPGDPLTPFLPAREDAERLDPASIALPKIPVQPLGWGAAREILGRMKGDAVPRAWQGGLPFAYRVTGGPGLQVRLQVRQERRIGTTANVVGWLRGATHPDEIVVAGCHFDAWTFGAGDPHAGTIVLLEIARSFAAMAKEGWRPARTLVFANWAAEEFGIMGSTEWVEEHRDELSAGGVAYINLDMAAMGPDFSASAAPLLKDLIVDATREVPQARDAAKTVHELWLARHGGDPKFGDLGGGSDHLGFYAHLGIPAAGFGAWGSKGVSYHSNYETLTWYRKIVGDDYAPALMLSRVGARLLARLADAPVLPFSFERYAEDARRHLDTLVAGEGGDALASRLAPLRRAIDTYGGQALRVRRELDQALLEAKLDGPAIAAINRALMRLERTWLRPQGLPERPWYRSLYAATDPDSGYAPWMLPLLRWAKERGDAQDRAEAVAEYVRVFETLAGRLSEVEALLMREEEGQQAERAP